jgi:hypothetical protein
MSAYLILDRPGDEPSAGNDWNVLVGLLARLVDFLSGHVEDEEMAAQFKQYSDEGIGWLPLSAFTDDQVRDIVRVIRELLPAAAEAAFPPPDEHAGGTALRALVETVTRWSEFRRL